MTNVAAYGTLLKIGTSQVESTPIVGTGNSASTLDVTLTANGMANSPITTNVTVVTGDVPAELARKVAIDLNLDSDITALHRVEADGPNIVVTKLVAIANDGTLNIAYTGGGTTPDATSDNTIAGVVVVTVAQVTNIGGPSLAADNIDTTTHDSTNAWEDSVIGILRSGDLTMDIVYDPADDTHDATGGAGLLTRLKDIVRTNFSLIFSDSGATTWGFDGDVTGFVPGAPVADGLTAAVTVKVTGLPILA